jgi:hypothetical protein
MEPACERVRRGAEDHRQDPRRCKLEAGPGAYFSFSLSVVECPPVWNSQIT